MNEAYHPYLAGLASVLAALAYSITLSSCVPETYVIPLPTTSDTSSSSTSTSAGMDTLDGATTGSSSVADTPTTSNDTGTTCIPIDDAESWWDSTWRRRRRLEINAPAFPSYLRDFPLRDFPLLLRVNVDDLGPTWTERGGADLRFRSADQDIAIAYDIDDVEDEGDLLLWLRLPELDPSAGPTSLWMYHDNPDADSGSDPPSVWASFISVHHLGSNLRDSAGEHHGTSTSEPVVCEGPCEPLIGRSRSFEPLLLQEVVLDGHESYDLGSDPYTSTISFTISLWMRSTSFSLQPWAGLVAKGDAWRIQVTESADRRFDDRIGFGFDCVLSSCDGFVDVFDHYNLPASSSEVDDNVNDGAWHHVVVTLEAVGIDVVVPPAYVPNLQPRIYIDGLEVVEGPILNQMVLYANEQPVRFGHNISAPPPRRWKGDLDEIRISAGRRSPGAIAADHAIVVRDDLVSIEEEQVLCP